MPSYHECCGKIKMKCPNCGEVAELYDYLIDKILRAPEPGTVGATFGLGFVGPSMLDAGPANPVANQVITLLNAPVNQSPYVLMDP
jgi:hypothetical protein